MLFGKSPSKMTDEQKKAQIDAMYTRARAAFPGVPEMTAEQVIARQKAGEELVLVDVRTEAEQSVSMIPGALTVEQFEAAADEHRDATVVCYCTIGGRSGRYTQQLGERGITASNMPGAVLSWTHCGGSFHDADGPTKRVHTHSPKYAFLAEGYEAVWE